MKNLEEYTSFMSEHGSNVSLSWNRAQKAWTCSWMALGRQFHGVSNSPSMAVVGALSTAGMVLAGATSPTTKVAFGKAIQIGGEAAAIELAHAAMDEIEMLAARRTT